MTAPLSGSKLAALVGLLLVPSFAHAHAGLDADVARLSRQLERASSPELLLRRAGKLRQLERFEDAIADVEQARRTGAAAADWRLELGLVHAAAKRYPPALEHLDAYLAAGWASTSALDARADVLEATGRLDEAALDLQRAIALAPDPERYLLLSRLEQRRGRPEDAARVLARGIDVLGGPVVLRHALIALERRRRGYDAALAQARAAMAGLAVKAEWRLIAAEILAEARRPAEQQTELTLAIAELDALLGRRRSTLHQQLKERAQAALTTARSRQ